MKWTKVALVLVIPALALLLLGQSMRPPAAEAKPTAIVTISLTDCTTFGSAYDWNDDERIDPYDGPILLSNCQSLNASGIVGTVVEVLGGDRDDFKPADLAPIDREGGQMHEKDGVMFIIAFVSNDTPVSFDADEGVFEAGVYRSSVLCGPPSNPDSNFDDKDCDGDGVMDDGVVVAKLMPKDSGPTRGPAMVRVRQGMLEMEEKYTVVGEPWNIEVTANKKVIQTGAASCELFTDTKGYIKAMDSPEMTPVITKVTDSDGTPVTGALVRFRTDDEYTGTAARMLVPTLESALGVAAPNVLCGTVNPGTVEFTATLVSGADHQDIDLGLDNQARLGRHASVEVEVRDPPTKMVLSASPGSLACDGTATTAVSATLTDAKDNPAVNGNAVRFEGKALGTVSPIEPLSLDGTAKTTLTPLSGMVNGVTVGAITTKQEMIDWDTLLHNPLAFIDETLLARLIEKDKSRTWRNVASECSDAVDGFDQDGNVNDGCPEVGDESESGSDCANSKDDDGDGAVNDGCPAVGSAETHLPTAEVNQLEGSLLVACSETLPGEAVPGLVPAAPVAPPAIAPPATGDGGFLGP